MCPVCVPWSCLGLINYEHMLLCPPLSSILGCQALEQCPEAQRELRMCLQGEWVPSIANPRYTGMSLGPETFQTQKNMHGFILAPWSSDFCQVSKSPLVPRSPPFWSPLPLLWCRNDLLLSNLSQGTLSVADNIWNGLFTVLSCPDRSLAWAGYRQSLAFTLFWFGF